uniref:KID domain-containing protein n=1 Tax=Hymenolepis diminuta TaxID=6216 RepID=A0A0R3SLK6_HYMDI
LSTCVGLPTCAIPSTSFSDDALADVSHRRAASDLVVITPLIANSPPISPFMQQQPIQQASFVGLKPPQTPDSGINQSSVSSYFYSSNSSSSNTFASSKMYSGSVDSSSAAANTSFSSNRFSWPKSNCSSSSTSSSTSEMSSLSTALSNNLRLTGDVSTAASGNSLFTSPPKNNGSVSSPTSGTPQRLPRFVAGTTIAEEDEEAEEAEEGNSNDPKSSATQIQSPPDSTTNPIGSSTVTDSMETGFAATVAQVSRRTGTSAQELYARMKEVRRRPEDVRNRLRGQANGMVSSSGNVIDGTTTGTSKRLSLPASLHLPPHLRQKAIQLLEEPMTRRERRMSLVSPGCGLHPI